MRATLEAQLSVLFKRKPGSLYPAKTNKMKNLRKCIPE